MFLLPHKFSGLQARCADKGFNLLFGARVLRHLVISLTSLLILLAILCATSFARQTNKTSPGRPGADAHWMTAAKDAVGTSTSIDSKVWFTLADGVMSEVFYPSVDYANLQALQFVIVGPVAEGAVSESRDMEHRIEVLDPHALSFRQINTTPNHSYTITKTYTVDPERNTILINVGVSSSSKAPFAVYVYADPSIANSGMHDTSKSVDGAFIASEGKIASAMVADCGFTEMTNGFLGTSDGLTQLKTNRRLTAIYDKAVDGNVVQVGGLKRPWGFTLALSFGKDSNEALSSAKASLRQGFDAVNQKYLAGWHQYTKQLRPAIPRYQAEVEMAAMVLKSHEDKTNRGATVASLSAPWGGGPNANESGTTGYHAVWARDLYEVATAQLALGDRLAATRALDYLFNVQQKPDGSFPQNSWLDGRPAGGSLQMDQVAYPLILAYQLDKTDSETWANHIKPAADFLVSNGPSTPQERWEEEKGFSPSTLAAEIAGLVCASDIASRNNDTASKVIYLATADEWARNLDSWTATSTGPYSRRPYYLRITENDDPNDGAKLEINSNGGIYDEREIVDAGFLELVRLGIRKPNDPLIMNSLSVVDRIIRVDTPKGQAWYRYNHDAFGESSEGGDYDGRNGKGRLWTLLTGERGQYELARGERDLALKRLDAMAAFAGPGGMIPEQVWNTSLPGKVLPGQGTGSATPLCWSMAQFVRLAFNIADGRNSDTPKIVVTHFADGRAPAKASVSISNLVKLNDPGTAGLPRFSAKVRVDPGTEVVLSEFGSARRIELDSQGGAELRFAIPDPQHVVTIAFRKRDGSSAVVRYHREDIIQLNTGLAGESQSDSPAIRQRLITAGQSPVILGDDAYFIYRGTGQNVEVAGDFTGWEPRSLYLSDSSGSGLKFLKLSFDKRTRAEYKYIVDGKWINDPLNRNTIESGVGTTNSVLTMPAYLPQTASAQTENKDLQKVGIYSKILGSSRTVQIYLPPHYKDEQTAYPVLYVQDGSEYVVRAKAAVIADELIRTRRVPPFIIVFVDPADRMKDYWANNQFAAFLATELVPYIDARFRTLHRRAARALMGASLGGVISTWTALKYPETFQIVAGQSTAFQIDDEKVVNGLAGLTSSRLPFRFYYDVGQLEPILDVNRRVRVMLGAKGFPVAFEEGQTGHNWTSWRDRLAGLFVAIWNERTIDEPFRSN